MLLQFIINQNAVKKNDLLMCKMVIYVRKSFFTIFSDETCLQIAHSFVGKHMVKMILIVMLIVELTEAI